MQGMSHSSSGLRARPRPQPTLQVTAAPPPDHSLLLTIVLVELVDKGAHTIVPQLDDAIM